MIDAAQNRPRSGGTGGITWCRKTPHRATEELEFLAATSQTAVSGPFGPKMGARAVLMPHRQRRLHQRPNVGGTPIRSTSAGAPLYPSAPKRDAAGEAGAVPSAKQNYPICTAEDPRCPREYSLPFLPCPHRRHLAAKTAGTHPAGSTLAEPDFGPENGVHLRPLFGPHLPKRLWASRCLACRRVTVHRPFRSRWRKRKARSKKGIQIDVSVHAAASHFSSAT